MTADQWYQIVVEFIGLAGAVGYGTHKRGKILEKQDEADNARVTRIEAEGELTRDEMKETRKAIARLEVRLEDAEKADDRLREEMHALRGKVDAADEHFTEALQAVKAGVLADVQDAFKKKSQTIVEPGKAPDTYDQTKTTFKGGKKS